MGDKDSNLVQELARKWKMKVERAGLTMKGCSESEIREIQDRQRVAFLPSIYQEFMRAFGHEGGGLRWIYGSEFRYPYVLDFKEETDILGTLPDDIFAFWASMDYENVLYFHTGDQDNDPVVFHITIGDIDYDDFKITEMGRLSEWFLEIIESNLNFPL
jgi:hypothetical protein